MLKMVKIVQNDYLGHISVLTMKTKCSRYQKYGQHLKVSGFFYQKTSTRTSNHRFEKKCENEGPNMGQIISGPLESGRNDSSSSRRNDSG